MNDYMNAMLASFWEDLKTGSGGPTMIVLMIVAAAAIVLLLVCLVLLARRSTVILDEGEGKKQVIKTGRYKAVDLPEPSRDGYTFAGWYTDAACTAPAGKKVQASAKSVTFYAKWEKIAVANETEDTVSDNAITEDSALQSEQAPAEDVLAEEIAEPAEESPAIQPSEDETPEEVDAGEIAEPAEDAESEENVKSEESEAVEEPAVETSAQAHEETVAEPAAEDAEDDADEEEASEGDEIDNALVTLVSGAKVFVQYRRSFRARLIQADDEMKDYYNRIRSKLLSYVGVKERVSWNYDSFNVGRRQFAKLNANKKSIILYLALSPEEVDEKYNFRDVSEKKRYASVPVRYKITRRQNCRWILRGLKKRSIYLTRNGMRSSKSA